MLTQEELKEIIFYDPKTGLFFWKVKRTFNVSLDKPAGCKMKIGYLCIRIKNKLYYNHRLAWLYVYGEWPKNQIDHINGKRDDNRIENLRDITQYQNCQLRHVHQKHNKCQMLGVILNKKGKRFIARHKNKWLGTFDTAIEAHNAYVSYRNKLSDEISKCIP